MYRTSSDQGLLKLEQRTRKLVEACDFQGARQLLDHMGHQVGGDRGRAFLRFKTFIERFEADEIEHAFYFALYQLQLDAASFNMLGSAAAKLCAPRFKEAGQARLAAWAYETAIQYEEAKACLAGLDVDPLTFSLTAPKQAVEHYAKKLQQGDAAAEEAHVGLVWALCKSGEEVAATHEARRAMQAFPQNVALHFALAASLEGRDDRAEAARVLEAAAQRFPQHDAIEATLADLYIDDEPKAIEAMWRAVRKNPRDLQHYSALALTLGPKRREELGKLNSEVRRVFDPNSAGGKWLAEKADEIRTGEFSSEFLEAVESVRSSKATMKSSLKELKALNRSEHSRAIYIVLGLAAAAASLALLYLL